MPAMSKRAVFALVLSPVLSLATGRIQGSTFRVPEHYPTIQEAMDHVREGIDEVAVSPGEYVITEPINFWGKAMTVRAEAGPRATILRVTDGDGYRTDRGVFFASSVERSSRLEGFTITGARGGDYATGGGIYCDLGSSPTIVNCIISGNRAFTGAGICCSQNSSPKLEHCTITGNVPAGILCEQGSKPFITDCIIWDNAGSHAFEGNPGAEIDHSCVESDRAWWGAGNLNVDPLFRGFGEPSEVYVDSSAPSPGDGTRARPFSSLAPALAFDPALSAGSPCRGAGHDGTDMGASAGVEDGSSVRDRTVHLVAGTHVLGHGNLVHHVSLLGEGQDRTFVEGSAWGLRTGRSLRDLTISGEIPALVQVCSGDRPEISGCTIADGATGISCDWATPTISNCILKGLSTGLECSGRESPAVVGCLFKENATGLRCFMDSMAKFRDCRFTENPQYALVAAGSSPSLENCIIDGNGFQGLDPAIILSDAWLSLSHSTITGNLGPGVECSHSSLDIESSIVWDNYGGSIRSDPNSSVEANRSCIDGGVPLKGSGNIDRAPLFLGFGPFSLVHVDGSAQPEGDGSWDRPYADLPSALRYSLVLAGSSPCLGKGKDDSNMGADTGVGGPPGEKEMTISIAPGDYSFQRLSLVHRVSLEGSGRESTRISGGVVGLRSGASIRSLTLSGSGKVLMGHGDTPEVSDCTITKDMGGGIECHGGSPTIRNCRFVNNGSSGLTIRYATSMVISDCIFEGNGGHGLHCENVNQGTLNNCSFTHNLGSGVYLDGTSITFSNCLIAQNGEEGLGCWWYSSPILQNSTIAGNGFEGLFLFFNSIPTLKGSIVWGNGKGLAYLGGETGIEADHSILEGDTVWPGEGNSNRDPLFMDPGSVNYRLRTDSPAIDAGSIDEAPPRDLDGADRPCGGGVDMGAYEACGDYFLRGDPDADGGRNLTDALFLLRYFFDSGLPPACEKAADSDDSGELDLNDVVVLLNYLYLHGPALQVPSPSCGADATPDALTCEDYRACP